MVDIRDNRSSSAASSRNEDALGEAFREGAACLIQVASWLLRDLSDSQNSGSARP